MHFTNIAWRKDKSAAFGVLRPAVQLHPGRRKKAIGILTHAMLQLRTDRPEPAGAFAKQPAISHPGLGP
jgi:hypothetical protein